MGMVALAVSTSVLIVPNSCDRVEAHTNPASNCGKLYCTLLCQHLSNHLIGSRHEVLWHECNPRDVGKLPTVIDEWCDSCCTLYMQIACLATLAQTAQPVPLAAPLLGQPRLRAWCAGHAPMARQLLHLDQHSAPVSTSLVSLQVGPLASSLWPLSSMAATACCGNGLTNYDTIITCLMHQMHDVMMTHHDASVDPTKSGATPGLLTTLVVCRDHAFRKTESASAIVTRLTTSPAVHKCRLPSGPRGAKLYRL